MANMVLYSLRFSLRLVMEIKSMVSIEIILMNQNSKVLRLIIFIFVLKLLLSEILESAKVLSWILFLKLWVVSLKTKKAQNFILKQLFILMTPTNTRSCTLTCQERKDITSMSTNMWMDPRQLFIYLTWTSDKVLNTLNSGSMNVSRVEKLQ